MRARLAEWWGPWLAALLSALSAVALVVYPLVFGKLWAVGPWLLAVAGFAWIAHDMADKVRERHREAHEQRRLLHRRVNVWVLPVDPLRVSSDPDVSLIARVLATPEPRTWPAGGWNPDAAAMPEYDGDLRRVAEQA